MEVPLAYLTQQPGQPWPRDSTTSCTDWAGTRQVPSQVVSRGRLPRWSPALPPLPSGPPLNVDDSCRFFYGELLKEPLGVDVLVEQLEETVPEERLAEDSCAAWDAVRTGVCPPSQ